MDQPTHELLVSIAAALALALFCCVFDILDKRAEDEIRAPFSAALVSALSIGMSTFFLLDGWHTSAYDRHDVWAWAVLVFGFGIIGTYLAATFVRWRIKPETGGLKIQRTLRATIFVPWEEIQSIRLYAFNTMRIDTVPKRRISLNTAYRGVGAFFLTAKKKGILFSPEAERSVKAHQMPSWLYAFGALGILTHHWWTKRQR